MVWMRSAEWGTRHDIPLTRIEHVTPTQGDVVIVGAGAFGATAALELRARGYAVTVVDRGPLPHVDASSTDISKMVRMDYGADVFYHELAEAALAGWDRWNREWPRPLLHDEGFLVLGPAPMTPGTFEYDSFHTLKDRGYDPPRIDAATLREQYPAWNAARYPDGYLSSRGGWAESGAVVGRLLECCQEAGTEFRSGTFAALTHRGSRVSGIRLTDGSELPADHVVVAAGAWTPVLLPWLSDALQAVGQPVVHLGVENPDDFRGPHFPPFAADISGAGWYGFPALDDGRLKLGHHADGHVVHPDQKGTVGKDHLDRTRTFLSESLPSLADAPVVGSRVCLYCDSFDGDLLIAQDPEREGLIVASGGSGHGFKFAPVIGALVADALEGRENRWDHRFRWRTGGDRRIEAARMSGNPGEQRSTRGDQSR
jgi:glycine/D-amino acid oxidase-like deaminating enzyme